MYEGIQNKERNAPQMHQNISNKTIKKENHSFYYVFAYVLLWFIFLKEIDRNKS